MHGLSGLNIFEIVSAKEFGICSVYIAMNFALLHSDNIWIATISLSLSLEDRSKNTQFNDYTFV